jgi:phage terminase small subunit
VDTLRAIADQHGVVEGTIRHRAKKEGWLRKPLRKPLRKIVTQESAYSVTESQHVLIEELTVDANPIQAAIRAGYANPSQAVAQLRANDAAQAAALERIEAVAARCGLTAELVMRSIVRELSFDPAKVFNADGTMKPLHEIDQETRMVLQSIETAQAGGSDSPVTVRKVKWAAPNQARQQAMQHLGLFLADNSQKPTTETIVEIRLVPLAPVMRDVTYEG